MGDLTSLPEIRSGDRFSIHPINIFVNHRFLLHQFNVMPNVNTKKMCNNISYAHVIGGNAKFLRPWEI